MMVPFYWLVLFKIREKRFQEEWKQSPLHYKELRSVSEGWITIVGGDVFFRVAGYHTTVAQQ